MGPPMGAAGFGQGYSLTAIAQPSFCLGLTKGSDTHETGRSQSVPDNNYACFADQIRV